MDILGARIILTNLYSNKLSRTKVAVSIPYIFNPGSQSPSHDLIGELVSAMYMGAVLYKCVPIINWGALLSATITCKLYNSFYDSNYTKVQYINGVSFE